MPQSGFIRRGAGFGAEKNEDETAECRQKVLLIGGLIINRRAESAPLSLIEIESIYLGVEMRPPAPLVPPALLLLPRETKTTINTTNVQRKEF